MAAAEATVPQEWVPKKPLPLPPPKGPPVPEAPHGPVAVTVTTPVLPSDEQDENWLQRDDEMDEKVDAAEVAEPQLALRQLATGVAEAASQKAVGDGQAVVDQAEDKQEA